VAEAGPADDQDVPTIAAIVSNPGVGDDQLFFLSRAIARIGTRGSELGAPLLARIERSPMPRDRDIVRTMARGINPCPRRPRNRFFCGSAHLPTTLSAPVKLGRR
jgi:hypothetical protein